MVIYDVGPKALRVLRNAMGKRVVAAARVDVLELGSMGRQTHVAGFLPSAPGAGPVAGAQPNSMPTWATTTTTCTDFSA
jgi:hypothetical protein